MVKSSKFKVQSSKFWKGISFVVVVAQFFFFLGAVPVRAAQPGTVVVQFKSAHALPDLNYERLYGGVYRAHVADLAGALATLRSDPDVEFAEADRPVREELAANDPVFTTDASDVSKQWYLPKMEVQQAWEKTTGKGVTVAIVDTGIDGKHEDLNDGRVVAGYLQYCQAGATATGDCLLRVSGDLAAGVNSDDNGHGTIVAGIVGAIPNNAKGIAGINWNVRLMPVKALDSEGSGFASDVAAGIHWATDHGARIINLSIGGPGLVGVEVLQEAITYAYNRGALIIAAAGNDAAVTGGDLDATPSLPVCADGGANMVIGVAATDIADRKARFSNYGSACVDLSAPGTGTFIDRQEKQGLISTYYDPARPGENDLYVRALGTSVAAPMVSGVAALMVSMFPDLALPALKDRLLSSVDNIDIYNGAGCNGSCVGKIGRGRINAYKAVNASEAFPSGTLLRGTDGRLFLIENGVKRPVSEFVRAQRFAGTAPTDSTVAQLDSYPTGLPLPPVDGTLVKSPDSPLVYLVEGGLLHPISYLAFVSRGFRFESIVVLQAAEIATYPPGEETLVQNGLLLKAVNGPAVYILQNGIRQLLSYFVFTQRGLDRQMIAAVSAEELTRFAVSSWLYPPLDGTLIRGDQAATVYVIEAGRRRAMNLAAFQGRGYQFFQVKTLAQSEVNGYELGADIVQ